MALKVKPPNSEVCMGMTSVTPAAESLGGASRAVGAKCPAAFAALSVEPLFFFVSAHSSRFKSSSKMPPSCS